LTIVALGTSLPELVTAITSLIKGHGALSLGNIIGANLFNLVLVNGVAVTLSPFEVPVSALINGINSSLLIDIPVMLLVMLPFLLLAVAGFVLRVEWLCTAGCILAGAGMIFLYDLRVKPALRYDAFLAEVHSGLTRQTVGALVRIGGDPVYQDGVNFYEVILNIYEDMNEEGERRFLLDAGKEIEQEWIGSDVAVISHGAYELLT